MKALSSDKTIVKFHNSYEEDENGCWIWQKSKTGGGYGHFSVTHHVNGVKRRYLNAHRYSWMLYHNRYDLTVKDQVYHTCGTKSCVNPAHLTLVTLPE